MELISASRIAKAQQRVAAGIHGVEPVPEAGQVPRTGLPLLDDGGRRTVGAAPVPGASADRKAWDAYLDDMKSIHDKDEKLFAQEATDGSDAFKTFAHQTDLIVKRHIGALHGTDR